MASSARLRTLRSTAPLAPVVGNDPTAACPSSPSAEPLDRLKALGLMLIAPVDAALAIVNQGYRRSLLAGCAVVTLAFYRQLSRLVHSGGSWSSRQA